MYEEMDKMISNITEDELEKITDYANKLMSVRDIAILLRINPSTLSLAIKTEGNAIADAYMRGKAQRVLDMHEREIELADAGSAQAMENLHGFLQKMEAGED